MTKLAWVLTFVGVAVSHLKIRQTWRWWSNRQLLRLHQEAEIIRDRLLQDSFILRRNLEHSLTEQPNPSVEACLTQLNTLHQTLNTLSDRLSPPYIQDDLSLAIAHLLKFWESEQPSLTIELVLPELWNAATHSTDRLILDGLDELLRIITPKLLTPRVIFVSLSTVKDYLNLEARIPDAQDLDIRSDLTHLNQSLRFLTGGHCFYSYQQQTLIWHYRQHRTTVFTKSTRED